MSGETDKARSNENIVEEIRETLKELQIKPPYILMPHSISGVYAMKYMDLYPEEVQAFVGIEASVPDQEKYDNENTSISGGLYGLVKFLDYSGLTRIINSSDDTYMADFSGSGSCTEKEIELVREVYSRKSIGKARLSESACLQQNFKELYDKKIPADIPALYFLSTDSCEKFNSQMKEQGNDDVTWEGLHEEVFTSKDTQKIIYLSGGHYLHWTNKDEIAKETINFLESQEKTSY